jgi:hypothetical protein
MIFMYYIVCTEYMQECLVRVEQTTRHVNLNKGEVQPTTCFVKRLYTFTMAINLHISRKLSLKSQLSTGVIIVLKSTQFNLEDLQDGMVHATHLDLYNKHNDIVLRITIRRGQNKVFFNDRAHKSLSNGWGQKQSLDLSLADVDRWKRSGVKISIQDCSTPSEKRFQVYFNLTTVYSFKKRFPGLATKLVYSSTAKFCRPQLSTPLEVSFYELNDLPLVERQVVESGM